MSSTQKSEISELHLPEVWLEGLRVAVIVPAYRAAGTIEGVLADIPSWVETIHVVDDASPDDTGARAATDPRVRLIAHDQTEVWAELPRRGIAKRCATDSTSWSRWTPMARWMPPTFPI